MKLVRVILLSVLVSVISGETLHAQLFGRKNALLREENASLRADNARLASAADSLEKLLSECRDSLEKSSSPVRCIYSDLPASDSLIIRWYDHQDALCNNMYDMDSVRFSSDVPDSVFIRRLSAIHSYIPLPFNDIVKKYCILYSEKIKEEMAGVIGRGEYYWPIIDDILGERGLPLELRTLVVVESKLRPTAFSRSGAAGLWQFIRSTARGCGLRIDSWTDERLDPYKSTMAAARYLSELHGIYGDWLLAIAAYNCGSGSMAKAMRRSGSRDYWKMYPYLPRETRCYVPAFVGAMYAVYYHRQHGIVPKKTDISTPVDTFILGSDVPFSRIEKYTGIPESKVAQFNPQYIRQIVPGAERPCTLRLPIEYCGLFMEKRDSICAGTTK